MHVKPLGIQPLLYDCLRRSHYPPLTQRRARRVGADSPLPPPPAGPGQLGELAEARQLGELAEARARELSRAQAVAPVSASYLSHSMYALRYFAGVLATQGVVTRVHRDRMKTDHHESVSPVGVNLWDVISLLALATSTYISSAQFMGWRQALCTEGCVGAPSPEGFSLYTVLEDGWLDLSTLSRATVLAVGSSLDNLGIGVAYGARGEHFSASSNLVIATANALGTLLSMAAGEIIAQVLPASAGPIICSVLFCILGVKGIADGLWARGIEPEESVDATAAKVVSWSTTVVLAVGLSVSNLASGVGAGLARIPIGLGTVTAFIVNFVFLALGEWAGYRLNGALPTYAMETISGCMLLYLGLSFGSEAALLQ